MQIFQVEGGASIVKLKFYVEVAEKFGVSLAIPRNEAREKSEKPCKVFNTNMYFWCKHIDLKREWTVQKKLGDLYPTTPSLYLVGFTPPAIDFPKENFQKWTIVAGILPQGISYVTWG